MKRSRRLRRKAKQDNPPRLRQTSATTDVEESRASVAVTVFWMISLMATLVAELFAFGAFLLPSWLGTRVPPFALPLALMVAAITGGFVLLTMLAAQWIRVIPAPSSVSWISLAIALPPLMLFLMTLGVTPA